MIAGASLMQMRLVVFVRRDQLFKGYRKRHFYIYLYQLSRLINTVKSIVKATVATGIGNVIGNKGGVGIAFSYNDSNLLFVTCHLAAHQRKIADRNTNFKDIMKSFSTFVQTLKSKPLLLTHNTMALLQ